METLIEVRLYDIEIGEYLKSPSNKELFLFQSLPPINSEHTYMKPFAPQKYVVNDIKCLNDGKYELLLERI